MNRGNAPQQLQDAALAAGNVLNLGSNTTVQCDTIAADNDLTTTDDVAIGGDLVVTGDTTLNTVNSLNVAGPEFPTGLRSTSGAIATDTISESTATAGVTIDSVLVKDGGVKCPNATTGLGYSTGAGGTVTQATSKVTAFTLSKLCGAITFAADQLDAAEVNSATWTNTAIAATDVVVFNHVSGGTIGAYTFNCQCGAGTATINIRNATAGNLSEAPVVQFMVLKAVNA